MNRRHTSVARHIGMLLTGTAFVTMVGVAAPGPVGATLRYVNRQDPTCGGAGPCYETIQAAVTAALAGDTVTIQPAGVYIEQIVVHGKNIGSAASEFDRILIQADPAAPPGSVVVSSAPEPCGGKTTRAALQFTRSHFVTVRGLTIAGNGGVGVLLSGGNAANSHVRLERNRIVGNRSACSQGVTLEAGNTATVLVNNLIHGHGQNGVAIQGRNRGPQYLIQNTIHANGGNGVWIARDHLVWLVNNVITHNGGAPGTSGGRSGVFQEPQNVPMPELVLLAHNLVCGNRLGEITGPALDADDTGNLTPTGSEGSGVVASPLCGSLTALYADLAGPDGVANTADDEFTPASGSPGLDAGVDPRTLGAPRDFDVAVTTDFYGTARPQVGRPNSPARFDIGAIEAVTTTPDTAPPTVTILRPGVGAHVRGTITLEARASDTGTGAASIEFRVDAPAIAAVPNPGQAEPFTASVPFDTTTVPDGVHTLRATATDRRGNTSVAAQSLLVDNTPPATEILGGPAGSVATSDVEFTFTGSDNLTSVGNLVFAWRVDGEPFSPFGPATVASFTALSEGSHTFEVRARDVAGNEETTPARRTFTVGFAPGLTAVDPSSARAGELVTITGQRFEPGATVVSFNGVPAVVRAVTPTAIVTTVPVGATSGPLQVTTPRGSASMPFTVGLTADFRLTALPAPPAVLRVIAGDRAAASVEATAGGTFASLVNLTTSPAVPGITVGFSSTAIAPGVSGFISFAVDSTVPAGRYAFTIAGQADVEARPIARTAPLIVEVVTPETPALTGSILTAESAPRPIPGVTVTLGAAFTLTDAAGNFLLLAPPAGPNLLFIDGRTASTPEAQFPIVETQVNVATSGASRVPFVIHLPKLDTAHAVALPVDTAGVTTRLAHATTPRIPGLEVTIPAGTRITDGNGNPVAELVITPVPVDRSPMPFPPGITPPLLFAINPGGAVPSQPLPISFPNVTSAPPGAKADLYYFSLAEGDWRTWGTGTVNADGTQVVSDPGAGLPRLAWHFFAQRAAVVDQVRARHLRSGEPVDLVTGRFVVDKTDLALPGRIPIAIQRTYRSESVAANALGIGWNLDLYETRILAAGGTVSLVMPNESSYVMSPDGAGRWTNAREPFLRGAVVSRLPGEFNFELRFKDGLVHRFQRIVGFANVAALDAIVDRNGNGVTITRATVGGTVFGRITRITGPAGRAFSLAYDAAGRLTSVTDPIDRVVRYGYDAQGRLTTVTDPAGGVTTYAYDAAHRIVSITDPRHITFITNQFDPNGRVVRQTQADGGVWRFAYALAGAAVTATTVTNPRGFSTSHRFTAEGFPLSTTNALGQTTTYEYAPGSNLLTAITDGLGRHTEFTYDGSGNLTSETRLARTPDAVATVLTYEPVFNQPVTLTDALGHTVRLAYDAAGNLTSVRDALDHTVALSYDPDGQLTTTTDGAGTTEFAHTDGVLSAVTNPLGHRWVGRLDPAGRLVASTDPLARVTQQQRDSLNRLTAITNALGAISTLEYDPNGNLLGVTDARGNATRYSYDGMDQLTTRTDPLLRPERYAYDTGGNLTSFTDRKGQVTTREYDALNQLRRVTFADGSTTTFIYDAARRLTEIRDSIAGTIVLTYDALDRLVSETTARGTVTYTYDLAGRRIAMSAPGQPPVRYAYDAADRLTEIAQGVSSVTFAYDTAGRRSRLVLPNGVATQYTYDAASRLTTLTYSRGETVIGTLTYDYDAAGNRVAVGGTWARTALPPPLLAAAYDAANQQLSFADRLLTYDDNGNLTSDGENAYTWDARDRLVAVAGAATATFDYDALGRRDRKTINGVPTVFVYDGLNPVQELGPHGATTTLLTGLDIDEYLTRTDPAGPRALLVDVLGTVLALTDPAGRVDSEYTYEPFGDTSATALSTANSHQFTGREHDDTGLYYYRARYYHPRLQRFVSEDALQGAGGDLNLYNYALNNPQAYVDPMGETPLAGCVIGALLEAAEAQLAGRKITTSAVATGCVMGAAGYGVMRAIPVVYRLIRAEQFSVRSAYSAVKSNRAAGLYAEEEVAAQLARAGNEIVGTHVRAMIGTKWRDIDILIRTPTGHLFAIEVKSGGSMRNTAQATFDAAMATKGARLVGRRTPVELRGSGSLKIPTALISVP